MLHSIHPKTKDSLQTPRFLGSTESTSWKLGVIMNNVKKEFEHSENLCITLKFLAKK